MIWSNSLVVSGDPAPKRSQSADRRLAAADRFQSMSVETEAVHEATDEVVEAFARLLPQLSSKAKPLDREAVGRLVATSTNTLLVARVEGVIVGTLTLVMSPLPSGLRAHIEDVVVDAAARGHGVGRVLIDKALALAADAGARSVDLTSRPSREAANRLYERAGFQRRESTVYRVALG
ncbi:GNAT family N-acetyltransferase [Streptomyces sp. NPDC054933]